ncbi:MAG TPA: CBS domain-containing protein [Candidatus Limnocylindrales bacterium]|nr:CBS domain-containing protein [Candidatus Limnocylindrales bacterium]
MLYLSQAIGRPVLDANGEPIGKVADLIVAVGDRYPPVTGLVVLTDRRRIFLPWTSVDHLDAAGARLRTQTIDIGKFQQRPNEILLRADLMDKQIVDIDGRKVVRVNDLRLDEIEGKLHLVAVDVGAAGLLRRLGVERGWRTIARNLKLGVPERYIDWEDVDPVETSIASIKLRVPHAGLAELHPADLATIIDQLAPKDRAGVLAALDDEAAADVFEEMEPETQVEVLEDLDPARAADILEEMSPDDAADLVADLSDETREELLALMERDEAEELGELLAYPEDTAGGMMTTEFVALPASLTCAQAIDRLRELEPDAETIYYVYVTDDEDRLVGVLSLRDLIVARPDTPVAEVMIPEPVTVGVLADEDEVAEVVAHYNLLAVPVVDASSHLVGIVTVDDAMDAILPDAWRKRLPRLAGRG